jgi:putative membrane protein
MKAPTRDSLNQSMDNAVKHYASLFKLPSFERVVLIDALLCVGGGLVFTLVVFRSLEGLERGLLLGVALFLANQAADYAMSGVILPCDTVYDARRSTTLSIFSWAIWYMFVFVGTILASFFGLSWWVRLILLGFSAAVIFRLIVLTASSRASQTRLFVASIVQPLACIVPFLVLWARVGQPITLQMLLFFPFSIIMAIIVSFTFIHLISQVGTKTLGIPALLILRAFLLNWIAGLNAPLEELLEKLGEERNVELSLLKFDSSRAEECIVVPSIHPGPFKNIGSSTLPSMLKHSAEEKLGCVVGVPHGLFGHELDLASQFQNQKVIENVLQALNFKVSGDLASPFVTTKNGEATACCQIFGNAGFLSVTLAPKTTEDIPEELGFTVRQEAVKRGLGCCAVVNSHNSIDGTNGMADALESLKSVSVECLERSISLKRERFSVGAATVFPKEFSLNDGMGEGGITAIVVEVGNQKTAYVIIDGNNMVSGLRETILSALNSIGIDSGEILTTDTHSVSALVLGARGYHPIGEVMNHDTLIKYVKEAANSALRKMEPAKAGCKDITVTGVKVIGKEKLERLSALTDKGLRRAKSVIVPLLLASGLVLMLFLLTV